MSVEETRTDSSVQVAHYRLTVVSSIWGVLRSAVKFRETGRLRNTQQVLGNMQSAKTGKSDAL